MSYLDKIVTRKRKEFFEIPKREGLSAVLQREPFTLIAEIKRGSPSKGYLASIDSPEFLAEQYVQGGAGALSILTDSDFQGSLNDLQRVAESCQGTPIIRKDFVIDPLQIAEAVAAGASTVLLIVKILGKRTKEMIDLAKSLGMDALVEIHDEKELTIAIDAGATIIGVNNRDLTTFTVDLAVSERLAPMIPQGILRVSESGIKTHADIQRLKASGYHAALIGESLVTAENPQQKIEEFLS
jgi:indole-3-glycerol phosphate synthase